MAFVSAPLLIRSSHRQIQNKCCIRSSAISPKNSRPDVSVDVPNQYEDGPFANLCIEVFRKNIQKNVLWISPRKGYDGLVEECRMLLAHKGPEEQRKVSMDAISALFLVPDGPKMFKRLFSNKPGLNSVVTTIFFKWLVGDCYTNKPEEGGYGVYIEKCRFLEQSGCKGLCVNMCQQPTQTFFTEVLGLPVKMTPNYEDSSCQMIFGVPPLPLDQDPAVTGDCLVNCKMSGTVRNRGEKTCYVSNEPE